MPRIQENLLQLYRSLPPAHAARLASRPIVVPVDELLTPGFILRHTGFTNFSALLDASDFSASQIAALEERTDHAWEMFIRGVSGFSNWGAMLKDARGEWIMRRLGLRVESVPVALQRRALL